MRSQRSCQSLEALKGEERRCPAWHPRRYHPASGAPVDAHGGGFIRGVFPGGVRMELLRRRRVDPYGGVEVTLGRPSDDGYGDALNELPRVGPHHVRGDYPIVASGGR